MADLQNAATTAEDLAVFLEDRDDIASAEATGNSITLTTQAGERYRVVIYPLADDE